MADDRPVGTKAEIEAAGENPQAWGSCAPSTPGPQGERGCRHYHTCIFRFAEYGGFRDKGPRNVGVLKHLEATGAAREDSMECFMAMDLQARDELSKKTGESFKIVAQEGEEIHTHSTVPETASGESNKGTNQRLKIVHGEEGAVDAQGNPLPYVVPKFPRPGEPGSLIAPNVLQTRRVLELRGKHEEQAQRARLMNRGKPTEAPKEPKRAGA